MDVTIVDVSEATGDDGVTTTSPGSGSGVSLTLLFRTSVNARPTVL